MSSLDKTVDVDMDVDVDVDVVVVSLATATEQNNLSRLSKIAIQVMNSILQVGNEAGVLPRTLSFYLCILPFTSIHCLCF